jgi:catechol 2,3-dioxygenase-like lactoylglutathione lyase family enzyme
MITALDLVKIQVRDLTAATLATQSLLARAAQSSEDNAIFRLDNMSLELSPSEDDKECLAGIAFEIADATAAFRACERRALQPREPVAFAETDATGAIREGHRIHLDESATFGVASVLNGYAPNGPAFTRSPATSDGAVTGLDHIVIRTVHPNRAAALYGARLGLDMRLDRTEPKWGARLMFFRCGDLIVEVVHDLKAEPSEAPDVLWGLSWRVADADAANARLKASGFDVSEIRPGRKPGTRVFTVRNNTLNVPTLFVEPAKSSRAD